MTYPRELFSIREEVTRANLAEYDRIQERNRKTIYELYPDYSNLDLTERLNIRRKLKQEGKII